jgi:hypothetical protein
MRSPRARARRMSPVATTVIRGGGCGGKGGGACTQLAKQNNTRVASARRVEAQGGKVGSSEAESVTQPGKICAECVFLECAIPIWERASAPVAGL